MEENDIGPINSGEGDFYSVFLSLVSLGFQRYLFISLG